VGRFAPAKNQLRLIRVFAEIHKQDPRSALLVVGRPDSELYLRFDKLVGALGLRDAVFVVGEVASVAAYVLAADLMLFPSHWEGLPGAAVEAAACGTPVLASQIPPHEELAGFFPLIRCLSLEQSNRRWAQTALEMRAPVALAQRHQALEWFLSTPFTLEMSVPKYSALWKGEQSGPAYES
jgi:glycosyltransferase involved in cell wall biosynthesis